MNKIRYIVFDPEKDAIISFFSDVDNAFKEVDNYIKETGKTAAVTIVDFSKVVIQMPKGKYS